MSSSQEALRQLDESPMSGFQLKTVVTAGMGFFTDAYDLFIIGVVSSILIETWHITSFETSALSSIALLASVLSTFLFGRIADTKGSKFIYGYELLVLAAGAIASALSPNVIWLLVFRFILGVGIGGDYPVSSTLMSEYANRKDRGKLITFVFSTQALGLIIYRMGAEHHDIPVSGRNLPGHCTHYCSWFYCWIRKVWRFYRSFHLPAHVK